MTQGILKIEGSIATISIDRPKALNALSREIVDEIDVLLDELAEKTDIRCMILHSSKNFAAGADIKEMAECNAAEAKAFLFSSTYNRIANLSFPVIAAIEGYALGGGMELAMTADLRIAGESAKMGFPETTLGIMPGAGGTVRVPLVVGEARAKELIFTGDIISADKAEKIGLVNSVVPDDQVLAEAYKLAGKIANRGPIAVAAAKSMIKMGLEEPSQEKSIAAEAERWANLFETEDQKEGMKAFLEKRKPTYKNR